MTATEIAARALREDLRLTRAYWNGSVLQQTFARYGLRQEVLSSYRQHRKAGYLPGVALSMALYDWDL